MTTKLCDHIPETYQNAQDVRTLFDEAEFQNIAQSAVKEVPQRNSALGACKENLYFGFFFDGTRNNYTKANATKSHSNVARLYDCFPGTDAPGVLQDAKWSYKDDTFKDFSNYFRTYISGVATPFDKIKDPGKGWQGLFNGAMG
jgi:hypothetical protein